MKMHCVVALQLLLLVGFQQPYLIGGQQQQHQEPPVVVSAAANAAAAANADNTVVVAAAAMNNNNDNKDVFDLMDVNGDGRMDRKEFNLAVHRFEDFLRHNPSTGSSSGGGDGGSWFGFGSTSGDGDASSNSNSNGKKKKDLSFLGGFTSAVAMILATEIGDKTFFIAAVLSMKQDRRFVFAGAILALVLMTVLSTLLGLLLPQFLDRKYTHLLAGALFGYFGIKLVYDSRSMANHKVSEELDEVEEELLHHHQHKKKSDTNSNSNMNMNMNMNNDNDNDMDYDDSCTDGDNYAGGDEAGKVDPENPMRNRNGHVNHTAKATPTKHNAKKPHNKRRKHQKQAWHSILLQSFTLTFVAEWGDRSQIATIALAAAKNPYGVTIGGCIGHCICTGLAVLGGRMLAARISEKTVSQWGGIIFIVFGIHSLFFES